MIEARKPSVRRPTEAHEPMEPGLYDPDDLLRMVVSFGAPRRRRARFEAQSGLDPDSLVFVDETDASTKTFHNSSAPSVLARGKPGSLTTSSTASKAPSSARETLDRGWRVSRPSARHGRQFATGGRRKACRGTGESRKILEHARVSR